MNRTTTITTDNDVDRRVLDRMIQGYATMVRQRVDAGFRPYLATFMFPRLPGSPRAIIGQMRDGVTGVYATFVTRVARHPTSPGSVATLPIMITAPDLPVPKRDKLPGSEIALNDGMHWHGVLLVPSNSRLRMPADEHFRLQQRLYVGDRSRLDRVDVRPITRAPDVAVDYVLKGSRRRSFSLDDVLILPRALSELV